MLMEQYTYEVPDVGTYVVRYRYPPYSGDLLPLELYFEPHDMWTPPQDPLLALWQHLMKEHLADG